MKRIMIAEPIFNGNEKKYLDECIETGWVSASGRFIHEFEAAFAEYCGVKHALSCSNGTVSLHLIMLALGIQPGDEIIMPALTYIATANAVRYCGGTPVFIDSEESTYNMDPDKIEAAITPRTKAIMPVHLYGLPADMERIVKIADERHLVVIEDAAEAHGSMIHGKKAGSFGKAASFSFFGNKIITCGEGGIVTTDDEDLYAYMLQLKTQGVDRQKRYWHNMVGYNYRMTNMQAAVGLGQLENIEWHLQQRERVAGLYKEYLSDCENIRMQAEPDGYHHAYWMNTVILDDFVKLTRDDVMRQMEEEYDIEMRPLFYPMHIMPPYYDSSVSCPVAERLANRGICLPSHGYLSEEDVAYICTAFKAIVSRSVK